MIECVLAHLVCEYERPLADATHPDYTEALGNGQSPTLQKKSIWVSI